MSINSYKLVPVKMFEDLIKGAQAAVPKSRSVSSIREEAENNIPDVASTQKYSTPNPPQMSMGGGNKNALAAPLPQWVYEDQGELPNYSQGKKVTDSFEEYRNMLDDNTIPEHIKIQLLQYLKDKYDKARMPREPSDELDDVDAYYDAYDKKTQSILNSMTGEKRAKALDIVRVFQNNTNLIRWNSAGDFLLPKYVDTSAINLNSLLKTLLYAGAGSAREIQATIDIIEPFYKSIKHNIVNKKISNRLDAIRDNASQRYVSLNSIRKKKNKIKINCHP